MGYLKSIGTTVIYIGLFLAVITFLPGLPPDAEFSELSPIQLRDLDRKVGPWNRLRNAEKLHVGEATYPESFDSYNGELYSGIIGGYVVRLEEGRVVPIVKFGQECDGIWQERKCGRPLGLKFDKKGNLYVVDAYYGIFKVNILTREYKNIVNISKPIDGKVPRLPNSLDITKNGDIYWTDSSTEFMLENGAYAALTDPSGRLIRYNAAKGKNEVLVQKLSFANGLALSDDESFIVVAETFMNRIIKYNIRGPKEGQYEIFIEGLPGSPDNIHSDGHGGFLVSLILVISPENPLLTQSLAPHPYIRKMLARLCAVIEAPLQLLQDIYPNIYAEKLVHLIGSFPGMRILDSARTSLVLRIDASGNIIEAIGSDDGITGISSAYIHNDYLWLGSPWLNYAMRVPLKQAFPDLANSEEQSSHVKNKKQPLKAAVSDAKSERIKRDTDSAAKPVTPQKVASPTIPKPTAAPTTTPKPSAAPTTTPKPTAAPTTSKPTTAPKASKIDKPTNKDINAKPTSESVNAKPKKNNAKMASDTKSDTKSNSPNTKPDTNNKVQENTAKTSTKSEKNVKLEQNASAKQKAPKSVETNRPKDSNKK